MLRTIHRLKSDVEQGKFRISFEFEEFDCDWEDEYELRDNDGFGEKAKECLLKSIALMYRRQYETALQAFDSLFSIVFANEYRDDDISFADLFEAGLIDLELSEVSLYYAFAALWVLRGTARNKKLLDLMAISASALDLQAILKIVDEPLPDRDAFAAEWYGFCATLPEQQWRRPEKTRLLIDSVLFRGGTAALSAFAEEHGEKYPQTYRELVQIHKNAGDRAQAVDWALRGLEALDAKSSVRAEIADQLAELASETDNPDIFRIGLTEGFRSSLNLSHFLRLHQIGDDAAIGQAVQYMIEQKERNADNDADYYCIRLLSGDDAFVWEQCAADHKSLGWSNSPKGKLFPLFIALSLKTPEIPHCIRELLRENFDGTSGILRRLQEAQGVRSEDALSDQIVRVLRFHPCFSDKGEGRDYLDWCQEETRKRVKAILEGQYRSSYHKVALLIVAVAEAIRSGKNAERSTEWIKEFRARYPRHSAFHREMREVLAKAGFAKLF
ncbi:MAG: hypothetical protein LBP73_08535 [Clostridiales Family XIII bacterium]|nr:hypothetical protein [Clostridiales Family XIII bacterium]